MTKRAVAVCLGLLLCDPLHARQPAAESLVVRVPSAALGGEQLATVMVPTGYAESRARYPVLYLLHGGGQDHTAFAARAWFSEQRVRHVIIVTPNAGDRWYVNSAADPNARYEDFVVRDLTRGPFLGSVGRAARLLHRHSFGAVALAAAIAAIPPASRRDGVPLTRRGGWWRRGCPASAAAPCR